MMDDRKRWLKIIGGLLILFVVVEVASYLLIDTSNPEVKTEPNWDSPRTRELTKTACFDCHSNETTWPWYAKIAPISWLTWNDVREGREVLNFSDWDNPRAAREISESIREGEMPPSFYLWMHGDADLSNAEKEELINGLQATLAQTNLN